MTHPRDDARDASPLTLRLYVARGAPNSVLARANLREILEAAGVSEYALEIIDCIDDPHRVLRDGIFVTPTLVKAAPDPAQTIVGALTDRDRVCAALGLSVSPEPAPLGGASAP
ncbi:MAG TPA: circadian clock KaiB family protein [Gemmatimonadaceae bacterium]